MVVCFPACDMFSKLPNVSVCVQVRWKLQHQRLQDHLLRPALTHRQQPSVQPRTRPQLRFVRETNPDGTQFLTRPSAWWCTRSSVQLHTHYYYQTLSIRLQLAKAEYCKTPHVSNTHVGLHLIKYIFFSNWKNSWPKSNFPLLRPLFGCQSFA